jgi:[acyl-carrier-protein] S-malonyltransferase
MAKTAWVFPGQGSQYVGMGRDLYDNVDAARAVFDRADEGLGFPLTRLCFEGPEDELRQTINAQPALVATALACLEATRAIGNENLPRPDYVAGHSLGEYTALAVAGVVDYTTAVRLARERGRLMHAAGQVAPGSMAAIIGMDEEVLAEICRQTNACIANINCPGQIVISGAADDVTRAAELAREKAASRAIPLQVSGAFHSYLMKTAVDGMAEFISAVTFNEPSIPVIGNTTARPITDAAGVRDELLNQLTSPVHWQRSVEYMTGNGATRFIEIGPGKVLTGLIRRISQEAETMNIGDLETIRGLAT